jgi:hypothetical protein
MDLKTDADGNALFCPVVQWGVNIAPNQTIGLMFDYTATMEDLAARRLTRVQLYMQAEYAAMMAQALAEHAAELSRRLAEGKTGSAPISTPTAAPISAPAGTITLG